MTSQYGSIALMEATHKARKAELKHYHSIMLSHLQANHTQQVLEMKSQHSYYEGIHLNIFILLMILLF